MNPAREWVVVVLGLIVIRRYPQSRALAWCGAGLSVAGMLSSGGLASLY